MPSEGSKLIYCPMCHKRLEGSDEERVKDVIMREQARTSARIKVSNSVGVRKALIASALLVVTIFAITEIVWLALAVVAILFLGMSTIQENERMKEILLKVTGIRVINMKLQALAEYLKVRFVHVPEHYKCEEIKDQASR